MAGLALGFAGVRALLAVSPPGLPRIGEKGAAVGVDWRVLAFTLGVSMLTGIVFGLFPALSASRADLNSALKESSNRSGTGFRQSKARSLLVVSEVSLALVLLVGSALLIRTFVALRGVDPGFNPHNVLTMEMSLTGDRFQKTAGVAQLGHDGLERLKAIPGVEDATFTCCLPLAGQFGLPFTIVGRPVENQKDTPDAGWMSTTPGYYNTFKIPILRGRDFTDQDTASSTPVALINQALAKKYWPNQNPVGQQIVIGHGVGPEFEEPARVIIGVVGDTHEGGLEHDPGRMMIVPQAQVTDGLTALNARILPMVWAIRTRGDPRQAIAAMTEQLRLASGGFAVTQVRTMDEMVSTSTARQSFNMLLLTIFGGDCAGAGGDWHLRTDGLLRGAAHAGDGHPHGAGSGSCGNSKARCLARDEAGDGRRGAWRWRGVRVDAADGEFAVWSEDVGPGGVCDGACDSDGRGSASSVAAGDAGFAA